ncbi:MAG TPA: radical SAM protein [Acidobacteriota bacterium]|nr:radical SAM protein [Acidobacteriota bacterium]
MSDRRGSISSHRVFSLSTLYLSVHTGCDCRCVMCDIWKADKNGVEISPVHLQSYVNDIRDLHVRKVVISGGEPLKQSNLWPFCRALRQEGVKVVLCSTGLLVERNAAEITSSCDQLTVPLHGSPAVHDRIMQRTGCAEMLATGVRTVLRCRPDFPVFGRSVVQKFNCDELQNVVRFGVEMGLRAVSFLGADVTSTAFNRPIPWDEPKIAQVALSHSDLCKLSRSIETLLTDFSREFESGFILNSPSQLWDIFRYYKALLGQGEFPPIRCRAPWKSAVIEADQSVRPCFFQPSYGKVGDQSLLAVLNSKTAVRFRRELKVTRNEICQRCVYAENRAVPFE